MFEWIAENYVTIIALTAVLLLISGAVILLVRQRKKGAHCGNCADCPYCGGCAQKKKGR